MRLARGKGVVVCGVLCLAVGVVSGQDWPQWRGPNRDNKVAGFTAPATWPKALTKKWQVTVGVGEASPLLVGDKIYVFGRQGGDEVTMCLDAASGKELWRDKYPAVKIAGPASGYPGPRSTPAVGEGKVCTLGVSGVVSCLDAATGKVVWRKETKSYPQFYTSTSPIIADGKCIVYADVLTAFDLAKGEVKWKWGSGEPPYGSPTLMTVAGTTTVVSPVLGGLAGVGLADGKLLWQVKFGGTGYQGNFSTPLIDGDKVIYTAAAKGGKGSGTAAFKIEKQGDKFAATEVWKVGLAAHQYHTPLLRDGLIYGVTVTGRNFFCLDAKTGETQWQDKTQRGQCGSILDAGTVLLALTSDMNLIAIRPTNKAYEEAAKYQVASSETWCVPVVAGQRIYVKDKGGSLTLWTID